VTPYIAKKVLGDSGSYLILIMMGMALMSTGAAEVMAVSKCRTAIKPMLLNFYLCFKCKIWKSFMFIYIHILSGYVK
jgi:hypothetical protein